VTASNGRGLLRLLDELGEGLVVVRQRVTGVRVARERKGLCEAPHSDERARLVVRRVRTVDLVVARRRGEVFGDLEHLLVRANRVESVGVRVQVRSGRQLRIERERALVRRRRGLVFLGHVSGDGEIAPLLGGREPERRVAIGLHRRRDVTRLAQELPRPFRRFGEARSSERADAVDRLRDVAVRHPRFFQSWSLPGSMATSQRCVSTASCISPFWKPFIRVEAFLPFDRTRHRALPERRQHGKLLLAPSLTSHREGRSELLEGVAFAALVREKDLRCFDSGAGVVVGDVRPP
jgi:hypothetical protein